MNGLLRDLALGTVGLGPGMLAPGAAGTDLIEAVGTLTILGRPNFTPGSPGSGCSQSVALGVGISVGSDPAGHEPYVGMTGVDGLNVSVEDGYMSVSGNTPWIPVSGSLGSDDTFTLEGSGEAAGVSGVSVKFEGKVTRDDQGNITGISGTLTVGVNGELYGTPVTYDVASG